MYCSRFRLEEGLGGFISFPSLVFPFPESLSPAHPFGRGEFLLSVPLRVGHKDPYIDRGGGGLQQPPTQPFAAVCVSFLERPCGSVVFRPPQRGLGGAMDGGSGGERNEERDKGCLLLVCPACPAQVSLVPACMCAYDRAQQQKDEKRGNDKKSGEFHVTNQRPSIQIKSNRVVLPLMHPWLPSHTARSTLTHTP